MKHYLHIAGACLLSSVALGAAHAAVSAEEAATLLAAAEKTCRDSVQLHPHTSAVAEQMTAEERIHFFEMMWEVAYADGVLDPEEDALIRRMVNLIHITDRDRVLARQRVLARLNQA